MIGLNRSLARSMMAAFVSLASLVTQVQAGGVPPTVTAIDPAPPAVTNGSSINVIRVSFSEPVTAGAADVELRDLSNAPIPFQATYDDINDQLVIDLDTPVENGYVTVILHDSIQNLAGIPLDGETDQALAPTFPTGNGLPGGVMAVRLVEFSGDVTLDGSVDFADLEELLDSWAQPNPLADFDGNGFVDFTDLNTLLDRWGSTLPTDDGADPTIMEMTPGSEDVLTGPPATVTIVFSEVMDGSTIDTRSLFLLDDSGVRLDPGSVQVNGATVVWDFNAMPVRGVSCDSYTVHISNGMADPSGRPLLRDLTPPLLSAQLLPDPPVVSHGLGNGITTDLVVTVSVETVNAEMLEISGPDGMMTVPVTMSPMTVDLDLHENRANQFVFTAISTCGDRSTPTAIEIINDRQAPELYVDFPVISDGEGTVVYADATDLQGRIGDLLSGFEGLDVHVTSDAGLDMDAAVNVGIGTNGTWFISGAQLLNDRKTNFVVTATDVAGNQARIDFGVRKGMVDTTRARFVIPSDGGNNQSAQIHRPLTAPIKVQVLRGDGTPFVNKLVTFTVTKSDGLVMSPSAVRGGPTPARMRQVRTDSNGFATVFWILGGDAGMGNNRVTVSSLDIQGTAVFCASALPGDPYQINIGSGNNQVGEIGSTLPMPLRAFVSDSCNGVGGVPVTFEVIRGNGLVNGASSATVNTTMTGHAQVSFKLGTTVGTNVIRADYPGNPNGPADFVVRGVRRGSGPTTFAGVVHNNASQPIEGALCALQVSGSVVGFDFTDADGRFVITGLPSGPARLHVSGASATAVGGMAVSPGSFPALYFEVILVTGIENSLPSPVLLPALNSNNAVPYSLTQDTILTVEGMEGLRMIIKPGSMYMRQGGPLAPAGTPVSLNQVHHDDIPMAMPDGAAPPFAWTLQPAGAYFDPPVIVEYPNMSGLPPGSVAYFLTFNHDTGEFEIVSTGTVSEDGSVIRTDPGDGLNIAGWGCNCPPYSVTGECESCDFEIFGPSEGAVTDTITINADTDNVTWSLQQADDPVARIVSQTGSSMTVEGLRAGSVTVVGTAPDDEGGECTSTHTIEFLTGMLTIVDPNPSHNVGGSITPNANALSQGGRQVDAIAADGVSRLLLRYKAPAAGTVRFTVNADSQGGSSAVDQVGMLSNPAGGGMGNPLTASTIQVGEDFYAFALLTAPQNFYRGSGDSARGLNNPRILHIEAEFMSSRGGDEPEMRDINLVPPPLVMAHGLWSGPETWAWNLSNDGRFYNQRVNYSGTNASPFEMNWPVVRNTIINTIQQYRDRGIASTQVDVIGHSMGGVLTRLYASKSSFRRNENFSRGDVHKLITLDTPHRGASTANLLVDNTGDPTVLGSLFQWLAYDDSGPTQSYCVECGAVYNLRTDYTPGALAAFTSIPAHAVYGTGGSDYSDIAALIGAVGSQLAPWLNALRLLDLGLDVVFGFDEHDLIVEVSSQRNGLPNGNTSHFSFYDGIHTSLPGSNNVSARVLELLMAPTNGPLYAAGFPAGRSDSAPREVNLPQINLRGGAINVLSPAPGAMVMSGDMVTVTVEPMVGFDFEVVAISGPGGESLYLESAPFTGMLSIPMTESGLRRIGIAARLAGSEDVALADVNIMVVPAATLMAIRPVIDSVVLTQFSPSFSPEFLGEYDDGIDRPIDLRDMILSVDNRRVAQLDGMGTLTSNRPGMTTLRAEYLGRTTEIAVSVAGLVGDYNDDGLVDSRDFVVFRECAASSDAACLDRADFDGDGDIDDDDFNTFVASMHYPADCNDNGMLDVEEIWNALVADGNLDGIPDSCGNWMEPRFDLTVGAQSIIADADGRFRIPNIAAPDLFGTNGPGSAPDFLSDDYLRATGTYLIDQDIYYAFSQPFQIRQGRAYTIGDLVITPTPPPFPDRIHIAPAAGQPSTITALNGTSQMEVIGILQDGSELDVTPRSSWTTYRTSNAAVASVGPDGLVTAHGNGPVFITAMNEGATSTVKLIVSLGDPLTTVEGFVLTPSETPVPDAVVTVLGQSQSAMTDASGFFSIPGVATTLGNINVRAISANFIGISGALVPVPGGITDAGIVDTQEAPDTSGREFFLVFQPNLGGAQLSVFISSSVPTAGHIEAPGFNDDFIVEPGITTTVILPSSLISNVNDGVHSQVVRVTADADVVVYGLNRVTSSTDAFASLPVETYGSSYRAMAYRGGAGGPSQLAVVAAVDGTTVTITPQSTLGSHPAGTPYTVVLDRLEAYQIQGTDVTGTLITADAPIGVFAGAQCTNVPTGVLYCDHLCEQIPPTTTWGRDVITLPIQSRLNGDTFRILAHMNNTSVSIDGPAPEMFTLNAGEFAERILEGNNEIFADKPILVAQFSNSTNYDGQTGDPFMMLVPPAEQFLAEYTFLTPTSGFSNNFVNVIAQTVDAQAGAVNLDGVALDPSMFQTVGDGFYSCAKLSIGTGSHTMNAAHPFGIYVYGFGSFDSYGYPGGLALEVITGP